MGKSNKISFQFISEPSDVNFGGKVHGGMVMKWIDQTAFACASNWANHYCVTVYVGGIRFYKPINIGELVRIDAAILYTGNTSIHIAVDVFSKPMGEALMRKTHCIIVFVALDEEGKPLSVEKWVPTTKEEKDMEQYALKLKNLRLSIEDEMKTYLSGYK